MVNKVLIGFVLLFVSVFPGFAAEKRVALVIGNGAYANAPKLANPVNDAASMEVMFKAANFDTVVRVADLSATQMRRVLRDFSDEVRDADVAVVFYAGHGIEVNGANYIIPVDAILERDLDVEDEAVSLERINQVLEPAKRLRLVILDACRENPFIRSMKRTLASRSIAQGLARIDNLSSDTLIAYAAKGGSTAADGDKANSPYTSALLKHLTTPGLDVRLALGRVRDEVLKNTGYRQEPFVYGSLGGSELPLVPGASPTPAAMPVASQTATPAQLPPRDPISLRMIEPHLITLRARLKRDPAENQSLLGVKISNVPDPEIAVAFGTGAKQGVWITRVLPNSAAEAAGVKPGDIIVKFEGIPVRSALDLATQVRLQPADTSVIIELWRIGEGPEDMISVLQHWGDQGNADAFLIMGRTREHGIASGEDQAEAARWYRKAAEAGNASAMNSLGYMYDVGRGLAKDDAEAVRWYRKAAEAGNPIAMNNLGGMYEVGRGLAKDDAEAVRWYRRAAEAGNAIAMTRLGYMYDVGRGLAKDDAEAVRWYRKAAEAGNPIAMNNLGGMYEVGRGLAKDDAEAVRWYRRAAEAGNASAMNSLGGMYAEGRGLPKDDAEAVRWYRKAAEAGNTEGMRHLAWGYSQGKGVAADAAAAAQWAYKVLESGEEHAIKLLIEETAMGTQDYRRALQQLLWSAGHYKAAIDGDMRPLMRAGMEEMIKH